MVEFTFFMVILLTVAIVTLAVGEACNAKLIRKSEDQIWDLKRYVKDELERLRNP